MNGAADRTPWPVAAARLAQRVTRRRRAGDVLRRLALGLVAGTLLAAALRAIGPGAAAWASVGVAVGALGGLLAGARAARRARPVDLGDAAWALDRLASAHERGLTAAVVAGAAGAEAAWAGTPVVPPAVRLHPPAGLVPALAAGLLAATVLAWPAPAARDRGETGKASAARPKGATAADAVEAGRREAQAEAATRDAAADRAVRETLGLPSSGPVDPSEILARLSSKEALEAARRAAPPGTEAAKALAPGGAESAEALSRALENERAARAEALRRQAAELLASGGALPVPPSRRAMVARYLASRLSDPEASGAR